jgi:hypothetical protein
VGEPPVEEGPLLDRSLRTEGGIGRGGIDR